MLDCAWQLRLPPRLLGLELAGRESSRTHTNHGAAMLNNPSIEYFPAPVMYNSKKPPMMLRFL